MRKGERKEYVEKEVMKERKKIVNLRKREEYIEINIHEERKLMKEN